MIAPQALARLGPSDVMVFSDQLCGSAGSAGENVSDGSVLALERFRAGRKSGELMLLPPPAELPRYWHEPAAAALSPVDVLVAFNGSSGSEKSRQPFLHLLHWDGQAWRAERAPVGEIAQLWAQAGAFWATDEDGALWMRRHAAWSILEWNEAASEAQALWSRGQITQIHAGEAGALWLVRTEDPRAGVVTSRIYRVRIEL